MGKNSTRGKRLMRSFVQSEYITTVWNWFMTLAAKAAEPVLVMSVLYASVKLLPVVRFPPQCDVVVFIAQFVALDIGGLSLNKLADQAKKDGNDEGEKRARRMSIALVGIMLVGVVMAGVNQIVKLDGQIGTIVDTILLIARAVMAVFYSRVIHSLKKDDPEPPVPDETEIEDVVRETVERALTKARTTLRQEMVSQLEASLSQRLDERLTELDMKQTAVMAHFKEEQAHLITEVITNVVETAGRKRGSAPSAHREPTRSPRPATVSSKVRSIAEAASRKQAGKREIDKVIWPLLHTGMSVRAIAAEANTSTATVGRSRQRWIAAQDTSVTDPEIPEQAETAERVI